MIIGMEFSKTKIESGKNFYRIAPIIITHSPRATENTKMYLGSAFFIGAFLYFAFGVLR